MSLSRFRRGLWKLRDLLTHSPGDFVVSAKDWEREQETLYVLQNKSLMKQIERSLKTHGEGKGHRLSPKDLVRRA